MTTCDNGSTNGGSGDDEGTFEMQGKYYSEPGFGDKPYEYNFQNDSSYTVTITVNNQTRTLSNSGSDYVYRITSFMFSTSTVSVKYSPMSKLIIRGPGSGNVRFEDKSGGGGGDGTETTHPIVATAWERGTASFTTVGDKEYLYFRENGIGEHQYYTQSGVILPNQIDSFTYTISGNTITLSRYINGSNSFTYSSGNSLTVGTRTYTKIAYGGGSGGADESAGKLTISGCPYSSTANAADIYAVSGNPSSVSTFLSAYATNAAGRGTISSGTVTWSIGKVPNGSYTIVIFALSGGKSVYYKATGVSITNGSGSVGWSNFNLFN